MLTKVILDGPLGKEFGREWNLAVNTPGEALRLIDANKPGVFLWIRDNLERYESYRVLCKYEDGREEELEEATFRIERKCSEIRFVPMIAGAGGGGTFQAILGIVIIALAIWNPLGWVAGTQMAVGAFGASMAMGGIAQMLAPKPNANSDSSARKDKTSYFFDGPMNTTTQGVPVQLIYGRCLVGSHAISAALTVDQLI